MQPWHKTQLAVEDHTGSDTPQGFCNAARFWRQVTAEVLRVSDEHIRVSSTHLSPDTSRRNRDLFQVAVAADDYDKNGSVHHDRRAPARSQGLFASRERDEYARMREDAMEHDGWRVRETSGGLSAVRKDFESLMTGLLFEVGGSDHALEAARTWKHKVRAWHWTSSDCDDDDDDDDDGDVVVVDDDGGMRLAEDGDGVAGHDAALDMTVDALQGCVSRLC
eukprot:3939460-Rhodomonas_salina.3